MRTISHWGWFRGFVCPMFQYVCPMCRDPHCMCVRRACKVKDSSLDRFFVARCMEPWIMMTQLDQHHLQLVGEAAASDSGIP